MTILTTGVYWTTDPIKVFVMTDKDFCVKIYLLLRVIWGRMIRSTE